MEKGFEKKIPLSVLNYQKRNNAFFKISVTFLLIIVLFLIGEGFYYLLIVKKEEKKSSGKFSNSYLTAPDSVFNSAEKKPVSYPSFLLDLPKENYYLRGDNTGFDVFGKIDSFDNLEKILTLDVKGKKAKFSVKDVRQIFILKDCYDLISFCAARQAQGAFNEIWEVVDRDVDKNLNFEQFLETLLIQGREVRVFLKVNGKIEESIPEVSQIILSEK